MCHKGGVICIYKVIYIYPYIYKIINYFDTIMWNNRFLYILITGFIFHIGCEDSRIERQSWVQDVSDWSGKGYVMWVTSAQGSC